CVTLKFCNYPTSAFISALPRTLPISPLFPYTTLFRSLLPKIAEEGEEDPEDLKEQLIQKLIQYKQFKEVCQELKVLEDQRHKLRSEEHTSELQSRFDLVCRLLLEKKKNSCITIGAQKN